MNAGRPIIGTDRVGACNDLLRDGINGYIYQAGDVGQLHQALIKVMAEPELREKMGQASLDMINQWSFEEDVQALGEALDTFVFRHPVMKRATSGL
jgi:glycosyltransferase involved in cell wall biosynthesis